MTVLCFSMQGKDAFEHTHDTSHLFIISMQEEDTLDQRMPNVICIHFSQLLDHCVHTCIHLMALMNILMLRHNSTRT